MSQPPAWAEKPGKYAETGCARGFLRNNEGQSGKWEKETEIRG